MNRSAKGFRLVSGILVLLNLVAIFLPITVCTRENYPTETWSALDYVTKVFSRTLPYDEAAGNEMTLLQMIWILGLMILPALLAVITSIWGIVGSARQIFSSILAFAVTGIYVGMIVNVPYLWPVNVENCVYSRGIACTLHLVFCILGCITAVIALLCTPRKAKARSAEIPQVNEIKQEQIQAKYNVILDEKQEQPQVQQSPQQTQIPQYIPGQPRGVMVGLTGIYAGAEIPFADGEYIKLGRLANNDLVFEGQAKVSRNHCRIKWNSSTGKFSFYDYSSNGTFVNGSEDCLPQNLEIEMVPGTVIAIGDENNTFRLE